MVFIIPVVGQALVVFQEDSRREERHTVQVGRLLGGVGWVRSLSLRVWNLTSRLLMRLYWGISRVL